MSFPANIHRHRQALLEMLAEAFRDPRKRSVVKTRGVSMAPFIRERDEVVVQALDAEAIAAGDVIAFRSGDLLLVHRVAAVGGGPGTRVFFEKGDNNLYLTAVGAERVLGVVVEVSAGRRRLALRGPRLRRLGRFAAAYGLRAVKVFDGARGLGRRLVTPGRLPSRLARRLLEGVLRAPLWLVLALARRLL